MMLKNEGATPGAILSATPGATARQRPVNGGAAHTPNTPSVAPALGGWVHATNGGRDLVPMPPFLSVGRVAERGYAFALCDLLETGKELVRVFSAIVFPTNFDFRVWRINRFCNAFHVGNGNCQKKHPIRQRVSFELAVCNNLDAGCPGQVEIDHSLKGVGLPARFGWNENSREYWREPLHILPPELRSGRLA